MRTWRVGSFSMGGALIFLGVFLLLSQFYNWDPAVALLAWWPVLFIILGLEIIIYLALSNKEKPFVTYDFVSIIFISVIGTAGLGIALIQTTGLLEVAGQVVKAEVRTVNLPKIEETSLGDIKRIVVDAQSYPLKIETTTENKVTLFGTYQEESAGEKHLIQQVEDYVLIEKNGDTLFLKLKELPHQRFTNVYNDADATLLIPPHLHLELNGLNRSLSIKPRNVESDWVIRTAGYVEIEVTGEEDLTVNAQHVAALGSGQWENVVNEDEENVYKSASIPFGKGTHSVTIVNADSVDVW